MIDPSYRYEFEQLTVYGVRRLVQGNMYDDAKLKRAIAWLHKKENEESPSGRNLRQDRVD
jgi:L-fucose isomerase-like protein